MNLPPTSILWFLCLAQTALACLQGGGQTEERKEIAKTQLQLASELVALSREAPPGDARPYVADPSQPPSVRLEAEGLHHVFAGRHALAVQRFMEAERAAPGRYSVAANLGTAQELNGQNEAALRWIREAIRRNPLSHEGTEWVHVAILEAKVRRERSPGAPFTPLIPLPADFEAGTQVTILDAKRRVSEIKHAIQYQLRERMKFVKPHDPYVADLLFTLSVIDGRLYGPESAYEYLRLAERYGYSDQTALAAARRAYLPLVLLGGIWALASPAFRFFAIACLGFLTLKTLFRCIRYLGWFNGIRAPSNTATGS